MPNKYRPTLVQQYVNGLKLHLNTNLVIALTMLLSLIGCSSLNTLNAIVPDGAAIQTSNSSYGPDEKQKLDIYQPSTFNNNTPVIIFFYGGRWQSGSRAEYAFVGQSLANRGYISVIADYRLYPSVEFPVFIDDAAKATAWVFEHIQDYGGDTKQVYLMGHSAGAHIATMLVANKTYLPAAGIKQHRVKGVISLSGPLNFKITDDDIKAVFANVNSYADTQPITFIDGSEPKMLLLHGKKDKTLLPSNSYSMAKKLNHLGGDATVITYKDMSHVGLLLALANAPFLYFAPVLDDIDSFIKQE
jgi:acetyl esterase/lipase